KRLDGTGGGRGRRPSLFPFESGPGGGGGIHDSSSSGFLANKTDTEYEFVMQYSSISSNCTGLNCLHLCLAGIPAERQNERSRSFAMKSELTSEDPFYQQIAERVEGLIASGTFRSGDRLPSVRAL